MIFYKGERIRQSLGHKKIKYKKNRANNNRPQKFPLNYHMKSYLIIVNEISIQSLALFMISVTTLLKLLDLFRILCIYGFVYIHIMKS